MTQGPNDKEMKRPSKKSPIVLTGRVFCDWNCFTMMCPAPDVVKSGDLIVWSWSGDSKTPSSKSSGGLLRVSVYDGKRRKALKVKRTRVHQHLKFDGEVLRERKLSALIPELRALVGRTLVPAQGGLEVGLVVVTADVVASPVAPNPAPSPVATSAAAPAPVAAKTATPVRAGKFIQCTLFD